MLDGNAVGTALIDARAGNPILAAYSPPGADPLGLLIKVSLDRERTFAAMTQANRTGLFLIVVGAALALPLGRRKEKEQDARARALFARLRPDLAADPAAMERELNALWRNIGRTFSEYAALDQLLAEGRVPLEGIEHADAAMAGPRPTIFAFVHLGHWDMVATQMALRYPWRGMAVWNVPENRTRALVAQAARDRLPGRLLQTGPGIWRAAVTFLADPANGMLLAADGHDRDKLCRFPSFGGLPPHGCQADKLVRLARRTGALILPLYSLRVAGARFRTVVQPPFDPAAMTHEAALAMLEARLAPVVLQHLTQWFMAIMFAPDAVRNQAPAESLLAA